MKRARISSPSASAAVAGDKVNIEVVYWSWSDWRMNRARISSPSESAAVAGDSTAEDGVVATPRGRVSTGNGLASKQSEAVSTGSEEGGCEKAVHMTLLVRWDAPSVIRPATATIRATTQPRAVPLAGTT